MIIFLIELIDELMDWFIKWIERFPVMIQWFLFLFLFIPVFVICICILLVPVLLKILFTAFLVGGFMWVVYQSFLFFDGVLPCFCGLNFLAFY